MQGSMDDVAGKVWTYLAQSGHYHSLLHILMNVQYGFQDVADGLSFWENSGEIERLVDFDGIIYFKIKGVTCPQNVPECATYAEYQRSLRSQPTAKRQSATPSARKNGSVGSGSKQRRKGV